MADNRQIIDEAAAYYTNKLKTHGTTAQGADWKDEASQTLRFRQFQYLLKGHSEASVTDLGCGFGSLLPFLRETGHTGPYTGVDVSSDMIEAAKNLHGEENRIHWHTGTEPKISTDFTVASGILNVKQDRPRDRWHTYVLDTIDVLARHSKLGFAFNVLSTHSDADKARPDLYYADPAEMLTYCYEKYGRRLALLQDYGLYEFTMIVRLD